MALSGCGGGKSVPSPASKEGRVVVQFRWPDRPAPTAGRAIPVLANFLRLQINGQKSDGTVFTLFTQTQQRPISGGTQEFVFPAVPSQNGLTLLASAFDIDPATSGAHEMASATTALNLAGQAEVHPTLTLGSTVTQLTLDRSGVGPVVPSEKQKIRFGEEAEFRVNALSATGEQILLDPTQELRVTYRGHTIPVQTGGIFRIAGDARTSSTGETLHLQQIGAKTAGAADGPSFDVALVVTARVDIILWAAIPGVDGGSYLTGSGLFRSLPADKGVFIEGTVAGDSSSSGPVYTIQKQGSANNELLKDYLDAVNGLLPNTIVDMRTATSVSGRFLVPQKRPDGTSGNPFTFGKGKAEAIGPILWPGSYTVTVTSADGSDRQIAVINVDPAGVRREIYYVDGAHGDDANSGLSPDKAFKSLDRVNKLTLQPGQQVLFAGGQTFTGTLQIPSTSSGQDGNPVTISSYGEGRARIDGGAKEGVVLDQCAFVAVRNIDAVGPGRKNGSEGSGVLLLSTHDIILDSMDISGFRISGVYAKGGERLRFTHLATHDNGGSGILVRGAEGNKPRGKDIYVGDCIADNNPGDPKNSSNHSGEGILVTDVDGSMIEYCEASNNGWDMVRRANGPYGIWGARNDRMVIQHCISHDNKTTGIDGGGFDFDDGVTNSILQYNLSYGNQGASILLFQFATYTVWKNNTCRYNIFYMDGGGKGGVGAGGPTDTSKNLMSGNTFYNNTIITTGTALYHFGPVPQSVYQNNVFVGGNYVLYGYFQDTVFDTNLYWQTIPKPTFTFTYINNKWVSYKTIEEWAAGTGSETRAGKRTYLLAEPLLVLPDSSSSLPTDPRTMTQMPYFRLRSGSPALRSGVLIPDNGGTDFFGNPIPAGQQPSLGAFETL